MHSNTRTRKIISLVISAVMVITMFPLMAFTSIAATSAVSSTGEWNLRSKETPQSGYYSRLKNNYTELDLEGPEYVTMVIANTEFNFMQTTDNQSMSYTTHFYSRKNNRLNGATINNVDTNYNNDTRYSSIVNSETWALVSGKVDDGGDASPNGDGMYGNLFNAASLAHYSFTVNFTANGSAVYYPEWEIDFNSGAAGTGTNFKTSTFVVDGSPINENPVFTIRVIDLREIRNLVNIAGSLNVDISDIVGSSDFSGNTYYSQETIDTMVAALRVRLLCDYSALDAQLARAATVGENVNGGLGGYLYDETLYNAFASVYAQAQAFDRFLMGDANSQNQADINAEALALQQAIDDLLPTRKALVSYYVDGVLYGRNTVDTSEGYNLHDATHERGSVYYIDPPTKDKYEFIGWADINGDLIPENTVITGDLDVYANFTVQLNGVSPASTSGRWDHIPSSSNSDGRGEHYVTMWVEDTTFNFVQTHDNETFSFYTDLSAFKNSGTNYAVINSVNLISGDTDTDKWVNDCQVSNSNIASYCITGNAGDYPSGDPSGALPGENHGLDDDFVYQSITNVVTWRFVYDFTANGSDTYNPKWDMSYTTGSMSWMTQNYRLVGGYGDDNEPVVFTINVTDARGLINEINKAESILNNSNNGFDSATKAAIQAILDDIAANYTLDGSVYYTQTDIDTQIARIKNYIPDSMTIPCDYTELDAAIALADAKRTEYKNNSNNHFIDEVWTDFENAYTAATTIDRDLVIIDSNANQTLIDNTTAELIRAINALNYVSHVNEPCDYQVISPVVDDAISTYGDSIDDNNGQYDDDAWQDYIDALEAAQDAINQDYYVDSDGNNDNQQIIDDALQALEDAIAALNDPANQNAACDYTALDAAIAAAEAINNSDLFTPETYQALQDALTAGQAVDRDLYDNGTNQQIIDDAAQAINDAIANLLADAINNAENTDTTGMTDATVQALDDAIDNAETVAADTNSTAGDKADAINDITGAVDNLTPDKTELEEAITAGEGIDTTDIPQNLADALEDALTDGTAVDNDDDATVQEIKDATDAINGAIDGILEHVINEAENTDTTGMTDESIQDLQDAIDHANDVLNDPDATAQDKADAIAEVQDAVDGLTPDKTELEQAINVAQAVDTTDIPQNLADALEDALTDGTAVDNDDDATVQEIKDATDAINDAIDDILEYVIDEAENTDTTGMTPISEANLGDALQDAQDVYSDPNATAQDKADAINALVDALDGLTPDKTELEEAITAGESIDTTDIPQNLADALEDAITAGETVDADSDATVQEIKDATDAINDAIDDILEHVINEAENTDTTGMTDESIQDLQDAIDHANDVLNDPDATAQDKADAIEDIQNAVDGLTPDKTELEEAITAGESIDTTDIPQNLADALEDAITAGETVDADSDATVQEIKDATDAINDAIDDILEHVINEAENTDTTGMTDESIQDLQDAIDHANDVLNDPDATAQDKADAIEDIQNAVDNLTPDKSELEEKIEEAENADTTGVKPEVIDALEDAIENAQNVDNNPDATVDEIQDAIDQLEEALADLEDPNNWIEFNKFVPTAAGGVYINRVDSDNLYFMGLDAADTTLANVKTLLENDGRQIVAFRGDTQLTDADLIGTGCVIKCISIKDPTVVYEQATVILYGDVNGDGLINQDDYDAEFNETLFGQRIEGDVFRLAGDINNDGAIDGFDMAKVELQMTGARPIDQIGRSLKVNVDEINTNTVTTDDGTQTVDTAVKFTAVETEVEIAAKEYRDWDVDFAVSFNKDVNGADVALYGQYDAYGENWIGGNLSDGQIAAGEKTYLISDWIAPYTGGAVTVNYTDIVTSVREMNTAIHVNNPAQGLTVTVELVLTDPVSGRTFTAATYTYSY